MILYHYCSNDAFLSILKRKELWVSELSLSNDRMEGRWIREVFSQSCEGMDIDQADLDRLLTHLDSLIDIIGAAGFCLSEKGDLLSQWRGYADDGAGVSIGFSSEYLEELSEARKNGGDFSVSLKEVTYNLANQQETLSAPLKKILEQIAAGAFRSQLGGLLFQPSEEDIEIYKKAFSALSLQILILFPHIFTMKNPAFEEELEWRLVSIITRGGKDQLGDLPAMDFRATADRVIPFRKIPLQDLSTPPISEVILGPRNITPEDVIQGALSRFGYPDVKVIRSTASYR